MAKPSIKDMIHTLCELLSEQTREMKQLRETLETERKGLLHFRGEDLAQVHTRLEKAAARCLGLEKERRDLVSEIAGHFGMPAHQLSATALSRALEPNLGKKLAAFSKQAKEAASELQVEIRVGTELLCWSARCHEGVIRELAMGSPGEVPTYGKNGRKEQSKRRSGFLDARF
ncbi:MAG TPA: hypothetical protein ENK02_05390 [Planctomycetes bacterium]|nr:hypothetical protein [Planctomycetota bacterium]